ncbi:MAG: hypothetical protein NTX24_01865 [Candidatus Pacearchaeota archaeon]|nr:hypothetical protein [Candidatus Pacearchaeota archaeon]
MGLFKKRRAKETIWAPDEPPMPVPKPEIIVGPAGDSSMLAGETSGESAIGFLGSMAGANSDNSNPSVSSSRNPYGWEPSSSSSSISSSEPSGSSDHSERVERLHRKIERMNDQMDLLQKKLERVESKLGINDY